MTTDHPCEYDNCESDGFACYFEPPVQNDEPDYYYCATHAKEEGFCAGCGLFYAGTNGFDFAHPGYCDNCWSEIEAADPEDEGFDENAHQYDDDF